MFKLEISNMTMFNRISVLARVAISVLSMMTIDSCTSDDDFKIENVESLIRVNKLMDNVIIVSLGSDAVTAINTQDGIVVIDAGISNSLTAEYRKIIEKEFQKKNFAYLINTHSHWDHTGGNQVFSDAIIVGQENCVSEIRDYWKDKESIKDGTKKIIEDYNKKLANFDPDWQDSVEIYSQKLKYQCVLNDLFNDRIITLPTKTFKDTMSIDTGGITLEMIYFGKSHTQSDILIFIPELDLLFTGDLFSPAEENGSVSDDDTESGWGVIVKEWIERRLPNIKTIIRGHGEVTSPGSFS